jgi:hypothetical protein
VAFDDFLGDRQADPAALVFAPAVQALKHLEDALRILLLDADPVVRDREYHLAVLGDRVDPDVRRPVLGMELERIAEEVLQHLPKLDLVGEHRRQIAAFDPGAGLRDRRLQKPR